MATDFFSFRTVLPSDYDEIRAMHRSLFPLQYSDEFLRKACEGIGLSGGVLYSSVVTVPGDKNRIVGFIFCQLIQRAMCEERDALDQHSHSPQTCYILTLGLMPPYRRSGLGQRLLSQCKEYASACEDCGMVRNLSISVLMPFSIALANHLRLITPFIDIFACYSLQFTGYIFL